MGWFSKKVDSWERKPGDIAVRIESSDVKRSFVNKPFVVYDGTVALVFSQGRLLGELTSGRHDIDGPLRKWLAGDDPTTLIIIDEGDMSLDLAVENLYSRENIDLNMRLRMTIRLGDPEAFYLNVMKGRRQYMEGDLNSHMLPEVHDALLAFTSLQPIDDLYHNPALRKQAEDQIRSRVGESLARLGLALVGLNVVGVSSEQFDPHRKKQGEVTLEGRDAELEAARLSVLRKVRENLAEDASHKAITESELRDAINQAMHELGLKDRLRQDEMERLSAKLDQDALDYERERTQSREKDQIEHELEVDSTLKSHEREEADLDLEKFLSHRIKLAQGDEDIRDLERSGREKDWELARKVRDDALEARMAKKMQDVEIERERAETMSKADTATKIALGAGDAEALLELERLEAEKAMTPEQLLVQAAKQSEAAAAALAARFEAEGKMNEELQEQLQRQLDQERQTNREHAAQLERILRQAMEQMGRVTEAKARSQGPGDQTIVTGGHGTPTIINPRKQDGNQSQEAEG